MLETGSRSDVAKAYRDMILPSVTPSGQSFIYGSLPFRFPAAVELRGASAIGDAIIGAREYTSPAVQKELRILFTGKIDRKKA